MRQEQLAVVAVDSLHDPPVLIHAPARAPALVLDARTQQRPMEPGPLQLVWPHAQDPTPDANPAARRLRRACWPGQAPMSARFARGFSMRSAHDADATFHPRRGRYGRADGHAGQRLRRVRTRLFAWAA